MEHKLTVVQANDLIEGSYSLPIDELRVINLALTKIDSRKPNIGEIRIDVTEFIRTYGLQSDHRVYDKLRNAVKSIMRSPIKIPIGDEIEEIAWLDKNRYHRGDGHHVVIKFSREIEPFLFELKKKYTSVNLEHIAQLNTPFSFRLYQWLMQAKNLNKNKKGGAVQVELPVEWMKKKAGLESCYDDWRDFNKRVLLPAIEKINAHTNISILPPKPIRAGKKIASVAFVYALEKAINEKPIRPRLAKRPKVTKGSHEQGEWMRTNYKILTDYRKALKAYDKSQSLTLPDVRKLHDYCLGLGWMDKAAFYKKEINQRTPTKTIKEKQETAEEKLLRYAKELGVKVSLEKNQSNE